MLLARPFSQLRASPLENQKNGADVSTTTTFIRRFGLSSLVGSVSILAVTAATAQEDPSAFTRLGRIVLGAGGSESVAIDTPQAVTVLNQEDIDARQATTVGELFDSVPGVQAIGSGRIAGESFNIRGIGELAASDESRIIVTVDGATKFYEQYRLGSFFSDPELYRRVEILRGPASSTIYGAGAIGGVINFETKDASDFLLDDDTAAVRAKIQYDSNGNENLSSAIVALKPSDTVEFLGSINYRTAGNYEDGDGNEIEGSEFDALSGLAKVKLSFGDNLRQTLTASYTRWDSDLDDTQYSQTGSLGFGTVDREITDQTFALRYQNPVDGNDAFDLDVVLTYSNTEVVQTDAEFATVFPFSFSPLFQDSEYGYATTALKVENTSTIGGEAWEAFLTYGIQLSRQERTAEADGSGIEFHPEGTDRKLGVYAQGEFIFGDRLTVIPGIRADFVDLEPGEGVPGEDQSITAVSPKIAAHYQINDTFAVFGSVAQTERAPTLDELYSEDVSDFQAISPDLTKESALTAELGFSSSFFDLATDGDALQFKATAFHSKIDDLISVNPDEGTGPTDTVPLFINVDSATIYGLELEAAYNSEFVFGSLAFSDVRGEDDTTGETLTSIPARSLDLTIGGRLPEQGINFGWNGHFVDDIEYSSDPDDSFDSYVVHNLFLNWAVQTGAFEGAEVRVAVKNLFDEQFENSLAGDPGPGRSIGISLAKTF